ncbi:MAG: radical SAM protein [Treponema sp.]|nr:radical SAM protein [Treponema sp.]
MRNPARVILVQPPFVQLNGPYPAPYYLKSFLSARGYEAQVLDHSIQLFSRIFCRAGLEQIFRDLEKAKPRKKNDRYDIEHFLSEKELWLRSIDGIIEFLRGRNHELSHALALGNGLFPIGSRTEALIIQEGGKIGAPTGRLMATAILSDLADLITGTLDPHFSLTSYTPRLPGSGPAGFRNFSALTRQLDSYIIETFYRPLLREEWARIGPAGKEPLLLGLTIPFPGCLLGALACAQSAKQHLGPQVRIAIGGGYVNTELRSLNDPSVFDYVDYVCFDRGYGALSSVLDHIEGLPQGDRKANRPLYKTLHRENWSNQSDRLDQTAPKWSNQSDQSAKNRSNRSNQSDRLDQMTSNWSNQSDRLDQTTPNWSNQSDQHYADLDDQAVKTTFPDYAGVDFSPYLYPMDQVNPMHRLWSDGHWLKAYLAHGCYWHSCSFCDTTLDYIKCHIPVDVPQLFEHLVAQAELTGRRGVHFCDEAAPAWALVEFALLNRQAGLPLSFWGNIRYDRSFTPDVAAILGAGGLVGVSGGLETLTQESLGRLHKGITLKDGAFALAAFKEEGILCHAYLIYGYWDQKEGEIMNSAEILRQLFSEGLLDSAFWHKFILTRHSRVYEEKLRGLHPELKVKVPSPRGPTFALNDLSFEGEEKYDYYTLGLDLLLHEWMGGNTDLKVQEVFAKKKERPAIPRVYIEFLMDGYAEHRDRARKKAPGAGMVLFLGTRPWLEKDGKLSILHWRWKLTEHHLTFDTPGPAKALAALLGEASRGRGMEEGSFYGTLVKILEKNKAGNTWKELRGRGLVRYESRFDG